MQLLSEEVKQTPPCGHLAFDKQHILNDLELYATISH